MAQGKNITDLTELLLKCVAQPDPMLSMLDWLCTQLMKAEVSGIVGAEKDVHSSSRSDYRCGYRPLAARYPYGDNVPYSAETSKPWIHSAFCNGAQTQQSRIDPSHSRGIRTRRVHPEDGKVGPQFWHREPFPQLG